MKLWKLLLFSFTCGITGMAIKILCEQHGMFCSIVSGFLLGILVAFALLSIDSVKYFFMRE